jgi:ketosteroid isomerase-like protein
MVDPDATLKAIADADRAFAALAGTGGLSAALLGTLSDDALVFEPQAVSGRAWAASTAVPTGKFTWAPAWAATSAAGELAVTSGPIAYAAIPPDTSWAGQYVTVWARAGTAWKAALQMTIPAPGGKEIVFSTHKATGDGRPRGGPGAGEASRATLFIADRGLATAAMASGSVVAIPRVGATDMRLLRAGALPYVGPDSAALGLAAFDEHDGIRTFWQTRDLRMARSGDFGVTHGTYERQNASGGVTEHGAYLRVWERQPDGGWRILLDAQKPTP